MLARNSRRLAAGARLEKGEGTPTPHPPHPGRSRSHARGRSWEHKPHLQGSDVRGEQREKSPGWLGLGLRGPMQAGRCEDWGPQGGQLPLRVDQQ